MECVEEGFVAAPWGIEDSAPATVLQTPRPETEDVTAEVGGTGFEPVTSCMSKDLLKPQEHPLFSGISGVYRQLSPLASRRIQCQSSSRFRGSSARAGAINGRFRFWVAGAERKS